jgi:hypothetical protein
MTKCRLERIEMAFAHNLSGVDSGAAGAAPAAPISTPESEAPQALRSLEKRESEELLLKISRETVDKPPKV